MEQGKDHWMRVMAWVMSALMVWMSCVPSVSAAPSFQTEAEILEAYPDARIVHVSPEEYPQLAADLQQRGYQPSDNATRPATAPKDKPKQDDCAGQQEASGDTSRFNVNLNMNGGGNGKDAAVVFVIIGTVVIVVWVLYVFKYLFDLARGMRPCNGWFELSTGSDTLGVDDGERADFTSVRFATGFRDKGVSAGIGVELGHSDIYLPTIYPQPISGSYWMLGPMLKFNITQSENASAVQMNFLAGNTEHEAVSFIAKATIGIHLGIAEHMRLGFDWGAMKIDVQGDEGLVTQHDNYFILHGVTLGYRF